MLETSNLTRLEVGLWIVWLSVMLIKLAPHPAAMLQTTISVSFCVVVMVCLDNSNGFEGSKMINPTETPVSGLSGSETHLTRLSDFIPGSSRNCARRIDGASMAGIPDIDASMFSKRLGSFFGVESRIDGKCYDPFVIWTLNDISYAEHRGVRLIVIVCNSMYGFLFIEKRGTMAYSNLSE